MTNKGSINSLPIWWTMFKAQEELRAESANDENRIHPYTAILSFMGSGASHQVTAADLDALCDFVKSHQQGGDDHAANQ